MLSKKIVNISMENNINQTVDIKAINEKIEKESAFIDLLTLEMKKVIVGQSILGLLSYINCIKIGINLKF